MPGTNTSVARRRSPCQLLAELGVQISSRRLILASQSPFRAALLRDAGLVVEAVPAHIDEGAIKQASRAAGLSAEATAMTLAGLKAELVAERHPEALVIAADQLLVCGQEWFDKPPDLAAAARHLRALRGQTHMLVTAVLCQIGRQRVWQHLARPCLTMRALSDGFIERYVAAEGEVLTTTVGAYRVEGPGIQLFERIEGEQAAIVGLPLLPLLGFLREYKVLMD